MTGLDPHPTAFIDGFLKEAAKALPKPFGVGDANKATNRAVPKGPQRYSQPVAQPSITRPDLVSSQKTVPPPPVQ